jgi:hypothetical protein
MPIDAPFPILNEARKKRWYTCLDVHNQSKDQNSNL